MAKNKKAQPIFNTNRRIRLGIWGLGRGLTFYNAAKALNFDIVAGCDYNQHMRDNFMRLNPGAVATADAKEFLAMDFDAVLLATFCPAHADDAIACLAAGKHVLSEVTSFHTVAEGVRLADAVEKSGKIYNLAENYPFSAGNMWLARKWREGLFGELMYAEFEYVHECRTLAYTYIDGNPIIPGNQAHSWRSWLDFHYYNTHSLGPMMHITGTRPTRVTALPGRQALAGYPLPPGMGMGGIASSLINMSNGGVVRNLMGATTNDTHVQRIWGTLGAADASDGTLKLRLGASGGSPKLPIIPHWDELGELAATTGHGGGDFWVLYYFARQILTGEPAPFDIYNAADCTLPGILAVRSAAENGRPLDVPDFRDKSQRNACRDDHFAQKRFDAKNGLFPANADTAISHTFSITMRDLIGLSTQFRAYRDFARIAEDMTTPSSAVMLADKVLASAARYADVVKAAKVICDAYPQSEAARVLGEMMVIGHADEVLKPDFEKKIRAERGALNKRATKIEAARAKAGAKTTPTDPFASPFVMSAKLSKLYPLGKGLEVAPPIKLKDNAGWKKIVAVPHGGETGFLNAFQILGSKDGIAYIAFEAKFAKAGQWDLRVGHDGGVRVFVDGKPVFLSAKRENPARRDRSTVPLKLKAGKHSFVIALATDSGRGWGVYARFAVPKSLQKKGKAVQFPEYVTAK